MTEAPIGHPEIITENFDDISTYFGDIKCKVLPPRGLLHPVLPHRVKNKLMFPLCKTCADKADPLNRNPCAHTDEERAIEGTWAHTEIMKAIEKGYEILRVHEVWHFPEHTDALFKEYVNTFLKIKQEASGYPEWCVTEEQKQAYVDDYYEHEGIRLDPAKIRKNPGMRSIAKLMLNSLWGKFGQRENLDQVEIVSDCSRWFELLDTTTYEVSAVHLINDEMIRVQFRMVGELFVKSSNKVNVPIAAFTTTYARLKLYDLLDLLQDRVLYYDTDSVFYVHKPGEPDPPLGDYLGDLTNELKGDDYITSFVSGGPKNYAYQTKNGKSVTRIRGFTRDYATTTMLHYDMMKELVCLYVDPKEESEKVTITRDNIVRDKKESKIYTKKQKKDYRIVYNKRVVNENYETVPYGY